MAPSIPPLHASDRPATHDPDAVPPLREAPDEATWRAMSPAAREAFLVEANEALSDPAELMSEGRPHKRAKSRAVDMLGLHFRALGRSIYVAEDMAVVYPGEKPFSPDVLAVVDVPQPEDDERLAWVVVDEGRGPDWVLEVLHRGDRQKDLVANVERYARLGIPEYFVYDRAQQRVLGYRLPADARRYQRIVPQAGRYASQVLGLDLAIERGSLRFFHGMSELFGSDDLIARLSGMVERLEARADAEAERAEREAQRAEREAERSAWEARRAQGALEGLRTAVLGALETRGVVCSDALRVRLRESDDPAVLQRWLLRALTAARAEDVIDG